MGVKEIPYYFAGILMYINPTLQFLMGLLYFREALVWTSWWPLSSSGWGSCSPWRKKVRILRREKAAGKEDVLTPNTHS